MQLKPSCFLRDTTPVRAINDLNLGLKLTFWERIIAGVLFDD